MHLAVTSLRSVGTPCTFCAAIAPGRGNADASDQMTDILAQVGSFLGCALCACGKPQELCFVALRAEALHALP